MERPVQHIIRILDRTGDTQLAYDPTDVEAVRAIEDQFASLMAANFVAFDVSQSPGRVLKRFDPDATEVIITPRFAGG